MNNKIDWKRKFSSRKFWLAIAAFVASIVIFITNDEQMSIKAASLVMGGGCVVAYIVSEGWADSKHTSDGYLETLVNLLNAPNYSMSSDDDKKEE